MQYFESFHLLSEFPLEIQNTIWKTAHTYLERPHIHAITCTEDKDGTPVLVSSSARINPLLNTCRRSRDAIISTKRLTYTFGAWTNFEIDIILLEKSDQHDRTRYGLGVGRPGTILCQYLQENKTHIATLSQVKNLALPISFNCISCSNAYDDIDHSILALKQALTGLRKLYLVISIKRQASAKPQKIRLAFECEDGNDKRTKKGKRRQTDADDQSDLDCTEVKTEDASSTHFESTKAIWRAAEPVIEDGELELKIIAVNDFEFFEDDVRTCENACN